MNSRDLTILSICFVGYTIIAVIPFSGNVVAYFISVLLFIYSSRPYRYLFIVCLPYFFDVTRFFLSGGVEVAISIILAVKGSDFPASCPEWYITFVRVFLLIYLVVYLPLEIFAARWTVKKLRLRERVGI